VKISADYVVVGSGLTGATIARMLHDAGREVVVIDRRSKVGGNVVDHTHESGVIVHTYGPHHFRTNQQRIWEFATRFAEFYRFDWWVMSLLPDQSFEHWPVTASYIEKRFGVDWKPERSGPAANFEEAALRMMPRAIYEEFVKGYTEKQWGVPAESLAANLAGRFVVNPTGEIRLKTHPYQGLPVDGYSKWMERMLAGVPVLLSTDYLEVRGDVEAKRVTVYTGPIDALFGYDQGRLMYRSQYREHRWVDSGSVGFEQPAPAVNFPTPEVPFVRQIEWKRMMHPTYAHGAFDDRVEGSIRGTLLTTETPYMPEKEDDYEYPFPSDQERAKAEGYRKRALMFDKFVPVGRLAEYKYFDMDQAIGHAMLLGDRLLGRER